MAWTNIFDLAEWDVYIRFKGITAAPNPDSRGFLVRASDLDPAVGTVTVVDGVIVCDLEQISGDPEIDPAPEIVVMPVGTSPAAAPARVSVYDETAGGPLVTSNDGASLDPVESITDLGDGTYEAQYVPPSTGVAGGEPITNIALGADLQAGQGMSLSAYYGGF